MINKNLTEDTIKWHQHMGDLNQHALQKMIKRNMVLGFPSDTSNFSLCEHCLVGKQHKTPFPKGLATHVCTFLELVHSNVCGPKPTNSIKIFSYFVIYVDNFSRFIGIYFLKHKYEMFNNFQNYKAFIENPTNHKN